MDIQVVGAGYTGPKQYVVYSGCRTLSKALRLPLKNQGKAICLSSVSDSTGRKGFYPGHKAHYHL